MKKDELIALYFEGKLNELEKDQFETLMQTDAVFKAHVTLEEQVKTAIISVKKDNLRSRLKSLEQPKKKTNYYAIAIAASIILALGVFALLQPKTTQSNAQLFAAYFEPYDNIIVPASRGDEVTDAKSKAFRAYDLKNYAIASQQFESLYASTNTSYYLFYQAVCELQLGETDNAISHLKAHQQFTDKLSPQTNWYLALAYLKKGHTEDAKIVLQQIREKQTYQYEAAEAILKEMN